MKSIISYRLVVSYTGAGKLNVEALELIQDGWQPFGGPVISLDGDSTGLAQAFVRYAKEEA